MKAKDAHNRLASFEQALKSATLRLSELERLMQSLYEDKCNGTVPQTVFQTLMKKYEAERAEKAAALPELENKARAQRESTQDVKHWAEIIRRYTEITVLDEAILFELVDRIEVGNTQIVEGKRVCDIRVVYRYVGNVDTAMTAGRKARYDQAI